MFVLKNHNDPEPSEANFHERLSNSEHTVAQKHPPNDASIISFIDKNIYSEHTEKPAAQNDRLYAYPSTKKKDAVASVGE